MIAEVPEPLVTKSTPLAAAKPVTNGKTGHVLRTSATEIPIVQREPAELVLPANVPMRSLNATPQKTAPVKKPLAEQPLPAINAILVPLKKLTAPKLPDNITASAQPRLSSLTEVQEAAVAVF